MSEFDADFETLRERINDAYTNHFIDSDALDRIGNTMCLLYIDEAKKVAVAKGDIDPEDDYVPLFAEIEELYLQVSDKQRFLAELDVVLFQVNKFHDIEELADFVLSFRSK